jgi:exopolysaccharide biosynthesis polyprenyl glycosylphosphotransferase
MHPIRRQFLKHSAKIYDLCALACSLVFASVVGHSLPKGFNLTWLLALRVSLGNSLLFAALLVTWHYLLVLCGVYASKRMVRRRTEILEVVKATLLASALLFFAAKEFHIKIVTLPVVVFFGISSACVMVLGRIVVRSFLLALRRRGRNSRFLLIVGTNERAIEFARRITDRPEFGYKIVGFVDDDWAGTQCFEASGHIRCCDFAGLADFLRHNVVDEAAIYLPLRSYYEHSAQLVSLCERHGIGIRFDLQVFNLRAVNSRVQDLDENFQAITVPGPQKIMPAIAKRMMDCAFSLLLLVLFAPLFFVVAVFVKLTSPGPVFFRQTRVGLNKRQFSIYKFRTMIANAEQLQDQLLSMNEMSGPAFKMQKDPRITPLGRILRRTSIDELPQLMNVLTGDMSLVGPRAMSLRDYKLFDQDWHRRRFSVKPGITCLWQICGRNSIPFEQWMELDLQYIDKWSLWLDLKILAQTVPAVLRGTGAA